MKHRLFRGVHVDRILAYAIGYAQDRRNDARFAALRDELRIGAGHVVPKPAEAPARVEVGGSLVHPHDLLRAVVEYMGRGLEFADGPMPDELRRTMPYKEAGMRLHWRFLDDELVFGLEWDPAEVPE